MGAGVSHKVVLSCCLIVGDAHVRLLPRCLKSFLLRADGPVKDTEVVISFNGKDEAAVVASLQALGAREAKTLVPTIGQATYFTLEGEIPCVLHRQVWPNDFSAARNENFAYASGQWRMYIDADDVLPEPGDPVMAETRKLATTAGLHAPEAATLVSWLQSLPLHCNVVYAPYAYVINQAEKILVKTRRPRIVRWDPGWAWVEPVHERLAHALGRVSGVINPSLVIAHRPVLEGATRQKRNFEILTKNVEALETAKQELPSPLLYGLGEAAAAAGEHEVAEPRFVQAAEATPDNELKAHYLGLAARSAMEQSRFDAASRYALEIIGIYPDRPEGYNLAAEATFEMGQFSFSARWYEQALKMSVGESVMIEDRLELVIRPARIAAAVYYKLGRYQDALNATERVMDLCAMDDTLAKLREAARAKLQTLEVAELLGQGLKALADAGHIGLAARELAVLTPHLPGLIEISEKIAHRRQGLVDGAAEVPLDSLRGQLLYGGDTEEDVVVNAMLDDHEDALNVLEDAIRSTPLGASTRFLLHDPETPYRRITTLDLEAVGQPARLHTLKLVGLPDGNVVFGQAKEKLRPTRKTTRGVPDITIFCPEFAEPWGPWRLLQDGTGGSEESVVYLSRELSKRGYDVDVYAPLDAGQHRGLHVADGVYWRPLEAFDTLRAKPGVFISHRAPHAAGLPAVPLDRAYLWHQDARYPVSWRKETAEVFHHLFVSQWQADILSQDAGVKEIKGAIIGNGIPENCFDWQNDPGAGYDPLTCVYTSSPTRGLGWLLQLWPAILEAVPDARLRLYYGWQTAGFHPGKEALMEQVAKSPRTEWIGRRPVEQLQKEIEQAGVWLYPCDSWQEGFCIAGVRAAAAGLAGAYADIAALSEVQCPTFYWVCPEKPDEVAITTPAGQKAFVELAVKALIEAKDTEKRRTRSNWARQHTWTLVTDRLLADVEKRGFLK